MKLHRDGTLEGTPEEIAAFMKLKDPMFGKTYVPISQGTVSSGKINCHSITHEDVKRYEEMFAANGIDIKTAHN